MDFASIIRRRIPGLRTCKEPSTLISHGRDWTRFREPSPSLVTFPGTVEQVSQLVSLAAAERIPLVPSGGRTGLSGGAVAANGEVVVSFDRMNRVLDFNETDRTVTVEAGVTTAAVQELAREKRLFYPVSFASEGSSQIGGNIATNAGGIRVLRYGLTRERVAGLKAVTGQGAVINCNRGLVKNASGYDFRHLFVGSEGTLGLIVEATLRLVEQPQDSRVMLLGVSNLDALMNVFSVLRSAARLSAFEFFNRRALGHVRRATGLAEPFEAQCPFYILTEFDCADDAAEQSALNGYERCVEQGWLLDGVISQSGRQAAELWRYRESISESISHYLPYKNDLSVAISRVPDFLHRLDKQIRVHFPDFEILWYGHIGDGNLHMNILKPEHMPLEEFERRCHDISERSYALTEELGGSISAEHGIGLLKQPWLHRVRSETEIELMQGIKRVFDPAGILNPGKLLPGR
jgi:FAD/FMN-containing dehydrogenase